MARLTKAQREWRPGMRKKPRSLKIMLASSVLSLEAFVALFFTLATLGLKRSEVAPGLILGGGAVAFSIVRRSTKPEPSALPPSVDVAPRP